MMATRPPLSPEIKAAIEQSRREIFRTAAVLYDLLFFPITSLFDGSLMSNILAAKNVPTQRMTDTLKLQLRDYFNVLFDAEAKYYLQLGSAETDLHSWLIDLASRTVQEVAKVAGDTRQDFHCHPNDRMKAIENASIDRVGHWMKLKPTTIALLPPPGARALLDNPVRPIEKLRSIDALPAPVDSVSQRRLARESVVLPLLQKKGMTPSKWATETGVDPSVVYDYLKGTSTPRPHNRNALADALGIKESDLPQ